jgi:hypothetical protein
MSGLPQSDVNDTVLNTFSHSVRGWCSSIRGGLLQYFKVRGQVPEIHSALLN